jgi:hypothetical protein
MKVCSNCFSDKELVAYIESFEKLGTCGVCQENKVNILDIDELEDFFQELVDNYETNDSGMSIREKIQSNWSLFSNHKAAADILNYILPKLNTAVINSESTVSYTSDILDNISYWEILKDELKWSKRFLTNIVHLTEDLGWDGFFNTQNQLGEDTTLFRARVHHSSGERAYTIDEMGTPPKDKIIGGRVNPLGIPSLYLSDNPETVLYEVRASYLDELTIGQFKLNYKSSI